MTIFPSWSHLCEGVAKFYGVHTHISRLCACQRLISLFELVSRLSLDWLVPQCQYMNSPNTQARCPVEQDTAVYFHAVCYSCHNVDLFAQQLHVVWTETCQASVWNPQCNFAWHQCESRGMFPVLLLDLIALLIQGIPRRITSCVAFVAGHVSTTTFFRRSVTLVCCSISDAPKE